MKILEMKFRLITCDAQWCSGDLLFCDFGLRKTFYLPVGATTIWVSLHDRTSKNRESIEVHVGWGGMGSRLVWNHGSGWCRSGWCSENIRSQLLRPFIGKKLWVQVEYLPGVK